MAGETKASGRYLMAAYLVGVLLVSFLLLRVIMWMDGVK